MISRGTPRRKPFHQEADLGVGDISITRERLEYVDFTAPFMQNGIGILYRNVDRHFKEIPHFLRPWTSELWLYVLTAVLATSLLFSFLSRLSSAEWVCKRRAGSSCRKLSGKGRLKNRFTLINSFWFVLASLLQQGTDMFPRALATRIMAAAWWMFAFVLISSYTASLASQLIAQRLHVPSIQSIQELAKQSRISYGCVLKGPIKAFLRDSADPCLQRVWSVMEMSTTTVFTNTLAEGVDRVKNEPGYAFLTDSQTVDYLVHHDCSFAQLPGFLETGGFGFATPHGSPITQLLTNKILQLQEDGTLRALRHRWWSSPVSIKRCASGASSEGASQKEAFSIGALVVALTIGCLVSLIIVVLECLWKIRCASRKERGFFLWEKIRRGVTTSESLQDSNLIVLDPPKEFQDDQENLPMTSYKGDSLA
ncbi:hypothetical protein HPB47_007841 [Ixodes persulcatus]|uniref:Uncharacterized protein n=1 Tax=Ixodes persulcatus TaxID=34615 RepID=A0AC60P786_IXOPE|nr:hypothetical protein HPB47_007841 [Ixodes persulcatus]